MGFLTDIITAGATIFGGPVTGGIVGGLLGVEPAKVPTALATTDAAGIISPILSGAAAITKVLAPSQITVGQPTGSMKNIVRTIVQTINPAGKIVNQDILEGSPWLMRKDFVVMKRVLRTLASGNEKVPRKTSRTPGKDKDLAKAQGMIQAFMSLGAGRPLIANIDND